MFLKVTMDNYPAHYVNLSIVRTISIIKRQEEPNLGFFDVCIHYVDNHKIILKTFEIEKDAEVWIENILSKIDKNFITIQKTTI